MASIFAPLTLTELGELRNELHREYRTAIPARDHGLMADLSYLMHEVSRVEQGREPSRAVQRHWSVA